MKVFDKNLKNGVSAIAIPNKNVETVNVMVLTRAGSRYESGKNLGIAHFLEHMAFKGTKRRTSPLAIGREIENLGAVANAFTWQEYTGFYIQGFKKHLGNFLDILSDIYLHSTFPEKEIKKEKGVIIEEIRMYKDDPKLAASRLFYKAAFGKHPLSRPILGTEESIKKMARQDFINFKADYYRPQSTLISIAGNIDCAKAFSLVEGFFGKFGASGEGQKNASVPAKVGPKVLIEKRNIDQVHFRIGIRSLDIFAPNNPTLDVLSTCLGGGFGSMLFELLRESMGVAYYVGSNNIGYTDTGVLMLSAGVTKGREREAISKVLSGISKMKSKDIDSKRLKRAKEFVKGGLFMGLESTAGLNEYFAFDKLLKGEVETPGSYAKKIDLVSSEDISNLLEKIFIPENITLALVADTGSEEKLLNILNV